MEGKDSIRAQHKSNFLALGLDFILIIRVIIIQLSIRGSVNLILTTV